MRSDNNGVMLADTKDFKVETFIHSNNEQNIDHKYIQLNENPLYTQITYILTIV